MPFSSIAGATKRGPVSDRDRLEFLPAALEIVETPASPFGRAIAILIAALFVFALLWASLAPVDIVATASGKVIPTGGIKVVQPFENAIVRAIRVRDGQSVKAGQVLVELDPTVSDAEINHIQTDLTTSEIDVARITASLSDDAGALQNYEPVNATSQAILSDQTRLLTHQLSEQRAKLAALDGQRAQREAEVATVTATIDKLQAVLPILKERVEIRRILFVNATGSKVNYLEILQALTEVERDVEVQKSKLEEAKSAAQAVTEARGQAVAEFKRTQYTQLVEAQRKTAGLRDDFQKARQRSQLQLLTAPVDGMVQQLAIHTVGGVVTAAQPLLVVVPTDATLEIEAMLSNRDVGFIRVGQEVEVKVDTFNFTRYGLLKGRIESISKDSITRDRPPAKTGDRTRGTEAATSEPAGQELNYAAKIALDRTVMNIDGKDIALSPGMAVTVEVKTGSRTVMSYLLSPLLRYRQESLRER